MRSLRQKITVCVLGFLISFGGSINIQPVLADTGTDRSDQQLTLEEAVDRALDHSYSLKIAEYNVEQNENKQESASSELDYIPLSGGNDEASSTYINLVQLSINLQMSKKTLDTEADSLIYDVYKKYTDVLAAQEQVKADEMALAYAKFKRLAAQVGYTAGTVSRQGRETAELSFTNSEVTLAQSRSSLEQCYLQLNELIGLNGQERPELASDLAWTPLEIDDLDVEIQRRLDSSPTLWQAQKSVELAELSLELYTTAGESNSTNYQTKEIDINKAELSASQSKSQLRQNLRTVYANICILEDQYNNKQQALKLAENDLATLQLKYELGLIPKGDLLAAEADLASQRKALKSLIYQHELLVLTFDKPWVS